MDLRKLKTLIELVETSGIAELEIQEGESACASPALHGDHAARGPPPVAPSQVIGIPAAAGPPSAPAPPPPPPAEPARREEPDGGHVLPPPRRARPSRSSRSATPCRKCNACIVEAMKLMNEIEADKSGVIKAILVENGQPGGVRPAAVRDRLTRRAHGPRPPSSPPPRPPNRQAVRQDPDRQPRRDRAASKRACREIEIKTVVVHPRPTATRSTCGSPTSRCASARRRRRRATSRAGDHRRGRGHRRAGHPPGYGFLSENADFAERSSARLRVHRPARRDDPP